jgi:hypothetical protein
VSAASLLLVREERLRDLGGLMLEMYRRDQFRQDLLVDRCIDRPARGRLAELDALLAAACPRGRRGPAARCEVRRSDLLGIEVLCAVRGRSPDHPAHRSNRHASEEEPRDYCPHCGVACEPLQEYCLECGSRLPANRGVVGVLATAWQRHLAWYPGDWIWPVAFFLVLTAIATTAAVAANSARKQAAPTLVATSPAVTVGPGATEGRLPVTIVTSTLPGAPAPTITTGPLPAAPGAPSTGASTVPAPRIRMRSPWPAGQTGYTLVLESLPPQAAAAPLPAARPSGRAQVGAAFDSSQYSSLHPGYFVFSGIYATQAEAAAAVSSAHAKGFPDAYQTPVTR